MKKEEGAVKIYIGDDMVKNKLKEIRMREYIMDTKEFSELINVKLKRYYEYEKGDSYPTLRKALEISIKLNKNVNDIWYLEL